MPRTTVHLHTAHTIGDVDPRMFGGFLEHMGRAVYGGVFDPDSPRADEHGCRTDVLEALTGLHLTAMRYPGGNFVSGYHWRDGIGSDRPAVRDLAWRCTEPNTFGTHEFLDLSERMGWTPMMSVNLGTGTPDEAREWLEYCNAPAGTTLGDLRARNGRTEPWNVKLWCLGNEMDGPWQLGHVSAEEYAARARETGTVMKTADPSIETVICGSSAPSMDTFLSWDRTVLETAGDADFVSLHRYVGNRTGDVEEYLAVTNSIDSQIEHVDAVCRYVRGATRSRKRAYLSFDEWNVWYKTAPDLDRDDWPVAPPIIEEVYDLADAIVVAGFLQSFIRHADVVKVANIAQIVNVIAPLLTTEDDVLVQAIYHPIAMISSRRAGTSLRCAIEGPRIESKRYGTTPVVDASAILGRDHLNAFCSNRSTTDPMEVVVELSGATPVGVVNAEIVTGPSPDAKNTWESRDLVRREPFDGFAIAGSTIRTELPPLSFAAVTVRVDR